MQKLLSIASSVMIASAIMCSSAARAEDDGDVCSGESILNVIRAAADAAACNPDNVLTTSSVVDDATARCGGKVGRSCERCKAKYAKKAASALKLLNFGPDAIADFRSKLAAITCQPGGEPTPQPVPSGTPGSPWAIALAQINIACPKDTLRCDALVPCYLTQVKNLKDSQGFPEEDARRLVKTLLENADCDHPQPHPSSTPPGLSTDVTAALNAISSGCPCVNTQRKSVYAQCLITAAQGVRNQYTADTLRHAFEQAISRHECSISEDEPDGEPH